MRRYKCPKMTMEFSKLREGLKSTSTSKLKDRTGMSCFGCTQVGNRRKRGTRQQKGNHLSSCDNRRRGLWTHIETTASESPARQRDSAAAESDTQVHVHVNLEFFMGRGRGCFSLSLWPQFRLSHILEAEKALLTLVLPPVETEAPQRTSLESPWGLPLLTPSLVKGEGFPTQVHFPPRLKESLRI